MMSCIVVSCIVAGNKACEGPRLRPLYILGCRVCRYHYNPSGLPDTLQYRIISEVQCDTYHGGEMNISNL
jgi:hypothetical protein